MAFKVCLHFLTFYPQEQTRQAWSIPKVKPKTGGHFLLGHKSRQQRSRNKPAAWPFIVTIGDKAQTNTLNH
ncbi:MAG: hypothetical protein FWC38_10200 [Proteobacteria bacterium]|nr:hypothetical protein [Pseudomonadota bacterium]MCL2308567.1 hypothetical protein [Pseudomonadota bacterium]